MVTPEKKLDLDDVKAALRESANSVDSLLRALSSKADAEFAATKAGKQLPTSSLSGANKAPTIEAAKKAKEVFEKTAAVIDGYLQPSAQRPTVK